MGVDEASRVLITTPDLELPGGVANFYRVLRRHLGPDKVYFRVGPVAGETGAIRTLFRMFADSWRFHRALSGGAYKAVHLNPSLVPRALLRDGLLVLVARLHRCPTLVFIHGWDPSVQARIGGRYRGLFRFIYGRVAAIAVLASEFREFLVSVGITCPVYLETTLVDDDVWTDVSASLVSRGGLPGMHLLYLSRLEKGKGLLETVDAFDLLRKQYPHAKLTVVGEGPERAVAEAAVAARQIPNIHFRGHIEGMEKVRAFTEADAYLLPTYYAEGMPTSVLEAMAYGLPVVTRPVGGLKDFFEDGRMGFWTESREPSAIASLVGRLAADPAKRREMGEYNREFARKRFAASSMAARLDAIYRSFAESG